MNISNNNSVYFFQKFQRYLVVFFILFYLIGFLGLAIPYTHSLFIRLFTVALILSFSAILIFHQGTCDIGTILVLSAIAVCGFLIEAVGVKTHLIFGYYIYGDTLGLKIFNTPLIIGLNWVMLSYIAAAITENFHISIPAKIVYASSLMLIYDTIMEQIAPKLGMWTWQDNIVPFSNYFAWFIVALVFQTFLRMARVNVKNSIAGPLYLIQILFFISLFIFFKISA